MYSDDLKQRALALDLEHQSNLRAVSQLLNSSACLGHPKSRYGTRATVRPRRRERLVFTDIGLVSVDTKIGCNVLKKRVIMWANIDNRKIDKKSGEALNIKLDKYEAFATLLMMSCWKCMG